MVSYGRKTSDCDLHLPVNKLMISPSLAVFLHRHKEPLLYIPAYARMLPTAIRLTILALLSSADIWMLMPMKSNIGWISGFFLRASGANVVAFSDESWRMIRGVIGEKAKYLKTGVDTKRYAPVCEEKKLSLRKKYGVPADKPIVLHVGHMTAGRNVAQLASIDEEFHVVLVTSSLTKAEQDMQVRMLLEDKENVTILDTYLPQVEEIYQMSDVYLFPVLDENSCIDVPLSALEAAACGLPVVTTPYGELKELINSEGFYRLNSFEPEYVNDLLRKAVRESHSARESVLAYDWDISAERLICEIMGEN